MPQNPTTNSQHDSMIRSVKFSCMTRLPCQPRRISRRTPRAPCLRMVGCAIVISYLTTFVLITRYEKGSHKAWALSLVSMGCLRSDKYHSEQTKRERRFFPPSPLVIGYTHIRDPHSRFPHISLATLCAHHPDTERSPLTESGQWKTGTFKT